MLRVDNLIYLLTKCLVLDYRRDSLQVYFGIRAAYLTEYERSRQAMAYEINRFAAIAMIKTVNDTVYAYKLIQFIYVTNILLIDIQMSFI